MRKNKNKNYSIVSSQSLKAWVPISAIQWLELLKAGKIRYRTSTFRPFSSKQLERSYQEAVSNLELVTTVMIGTGSS